MDCLGGFGISRKCDLEACMKKFKMIRGEEVIPKGMDPLDRILNDLEKNRRSSKFSERDNIDQWRKEIDPKVYNETER